jgi:hypothetical protein
MAAGETSAHLNLKLRALTWARDQGFSLSATEVRIPRSGFRADVVAATTHPGEERGRVAIFECKQAREDLLRDAADEPALRERTRRLAERLAELRTLIGGHRPDLRRGESLFPEFDDYDFSGLRHDTLHGVEAQMEIIQRKLLHSVKFARLHRYAPADYLYLVTEPNVLATHEVPIGWGWLLRVGEGLELQLPPTRHATDKKDRLAWLERIAAAGTRAIAKTLQAAVEAATSAHERAPAATGPKRANADRALSWASRSNLARQGMDSPAPN